VGEKREIVCQYVGAGLRVAKAVSIAGLGKSTYYYRSTGKPKGKRASTHTLKGGKMVTNEIVVSDLVGILTPEYHDYGYKVSTVLLKRQGYEINHKKVRRLMRDNHLLHPRNKRTVRTNKKFVQFTSPPLEKPFSTIEADIKYVYIHGTNKNAYLLTFLCTFSRYALIWDLDYSMRSNHVVALVRDLISHPLLQKQSNLNPLKVIIRTDNGPQFIARNLSETLTAMDIDHEFIQPGTPQQNGHIESFHSTVTRLVCDRNVFIDLDMARDIFCDFYHAYNNTRVKKELLYYPPGHFLKLWEDSNIGIKKDKKGKEIFFFREEPLPKSEDGSPTEDLLWQNKNTTRNNLIINPLEISPVL
jgi:putative transposase